MTSQTKKRTLLDIGDDMLALEEILTEIGGDVTEEEAEKAVEEWFAEIKGNLENKLDGYAALITELEARALARTNEAVRLAKRSSADMKAADQLKERLGYFFKIKNIKKIDTPRYKITMRADSFSVAFDGDAKTLPKEYQRVIPEKIIPGSIEADKNALKAALKADKELKINGVELISKHGKIKIS